MRLFLTALLALTLLFAVTLGMDDNKNSHRKAILSI